MVHAREDVFNAAKMAYTLYGWLLQEMAKEIGWDRALKVQEEVGDRFAEMIGEMFKEKCAGPKLDGKGIAASLDEVYRHFGSDFDIVAHDGDVTARTGHCPIYEGLTAAGLDPATVEKVCRAAASREYELFHKTFPELTVRLKFREQAAEACEEEFALAK
jgi:hypothetical protein